jgi:hypothetical protein
MIRKIKAKGNMVEITSDENGAVLIGRREALHRARAIVGIDKDAQWLCEALITAANEAKINDDGQPYSSQSLELWKATASDEDKKLP